MAEYRRILVIRRFYREDLEIGIALISLDKELIKKFLKHRDLFGMVSSKSSDKLDSLRFYGNHVCFTDNMNMEGFLTEVEKQALEREEPVLIPEGRKIPPYMAVEMMRNFIDIGANTVLFVGHHSCLAGEFVVSLSWEFLIRLLESQ